jgi:hypothetical protein
MKIKITRRLFDSDTDLVLVPKDTEIEAVPVDPKIIDVVDNAVVIKYNGQDVLVFEDEYEEII